MWWWPSVRIELTAKGGQACNVRVHRVMSGMDYEGFTTRHERHERHEREWVKTSDLNDISDIVDSKHISDITGIV